MWSCTLMLGYARHQCVKRPPPREGYNLLAIQAIMTSNFGGQGGEGKNPVFPPPPSAWNPSTLQTTHSSLVQLTVVIFGQEAFDFSGGSLSVSLEILLCCWVRYRQGSRLREKLKRFVNKHTFSGIRWKWKRVVTRRTKLSLTFPCFDNSNRPLNISMTNDKLTRPFPSGFVYCKQSKTETINIPPTEK